MVTPESGNVDTYAKGINNDFRIKAMMLHHAGETVFELSELVGPRGPRHGHIRHTEAQHRIRDFRVSACRHNNCPGVVKH